MEINESKYKDRNPEWTITRIRNILNDLGIFTVENWMDSEIGVYSVRVNVAGTLVGKNGKGTTPKYALASAYAEFMERYQNLLLAGGFSAEAAKRGDFYYYPDEKLIGAEDIKNAKDGVSDVLLAKFASAGENAVEEEDVFRMLAALNIHDKPDEFVALPFFNMKTGAVQYIPYALINPIGSNGMCAGNSPEEAVVQGISEILERYAVHKIVSEKITPPTVPDWYLKRFPTLLNIINNIEKTGQYKVIVKDCSLGEGYPVIGSIIADRLNQSYRVNLGAHPSFEIAAERTLTEIFQGDRLSTLSRKMQFDFLNEFGSKHDNIRNIVHNSTGKYPYEFFAEDASYPFTEFEDVSRYSNKQLVKNLLNKLMDKGHQVLVRDVSFADFPSYFVIIPDMSISKGAGFSTIQEFIRFRYYQALAKRAPRLRDEELLSLANFILTKFQTSPDFRLNELCDWNTRTMFRGRVTAFLFSALAYYKMERHSEAYKLLEALLSEMKQMKQGETASFQYVKCIRDYIGGMVKNAPREQIRQILRVFYTPQMAETVTVHMEAPEKLFDLLFDAEESPKRSHESNNVTEAVCRELQIKRKEVLKKGMPDQKDLRKLLENEV